MSERLGTTLSDEFVWLTLQDLTKEGLLENGDDLGDRRTSLSRRAVVKKFGLAPAVTLPVVLSVVAPSAAAQGSNGIRCKAPADCASGNCVSTFFLPVGSFCCPPGNGGTQPGSIGTAIGLECFDSCSSAGRNCCSGSAVPTTCDTGFCASQQQFCCACV